MLATCQSDLRGLRDRALLAFGFASALRRSELVALQVEDLTETAEGYRVTIRRSKTDQEGQGLRATRLTSLQTAVTGLWLAPAC
jgi:integrase